MKIIRIAASSGSTQLRNFLSRGDRNALVPDSDLLNALYLLDEIFKNGSYSTYAEILNYVSAYHSSLVSYLVEISKLNSVLSATMPPNYAMAVRGILFNYRPIISLVNSASPSHAYSPSEIDDKIRHLVSVFYYGGGDSLSNRTKSIQQPMFQKIYDEFKSIVSNAANSAGMTQLANAINGQNALLIPEVLYKNARVGKPSSHMAENSKEIVEKIIGNKYTSSTFDKVSRQNVEIIKESIMLSSGAGNYKQISDVQKQRLEKERLTADPSKLMPGIPPPTKSIEEEMPISTDASMWINSYALTYICSFFLYYYRLILSFPD